MIITTLNVCVSIKTKKGRKNKCLLSIKISDTNIGHIGKNNYAGVKSYFVKDSFMLIMH